MILDVVLGNNMDTTMWIKDLKSRLADNICVIDYDYGGLPTMNNGVMYISNIDAKKYLEKFDSVCFYKSMYIYPGMHDLKSLIKPNENSDYRKDL